MEMNPICPDRAMRNAAGGQPAACGRQVACGIRQSIPDNR
jgi:hypothetical protein